MCAKTFPLTAALPSIPVCPQKDGAVPSKHWTHVKPQSRPILSNVGQTGRLTTLTMNEDNEKQAEILSD